MSIKALNWAFDQPLPMAQKFVLVVLADYADEHHSCFPGQTTIAERTGSSESTVRRAIQSLEEKGYMQREHRQRNNGSRTSDRYVLAVNMTGRTKGGLTGQSDRAKPVTVTAPTGHDDTPLTLSYPPVVNQERSGKPDTRSPEHRAADDAYGKTGKAFNFIAVRQIAKWAINDRGKTEVEVSQAIVAAYEAGKPITKTVLGQHFDGITRQQAAKPGTLDRMEQTALLGQELQQQMQATRYPQIGA